MQKTISKLFYFLTNPNDDPWKTTVYCITPLEKTSFDGTQSLMPDSLERRHLIDDNFLWRTTFEGRIF